MIHSITNAVLNMFFVSLPEEFIWLIITLIFMGRFDLLDKYRWKENIRMVLIPVTCTAVLINLFRYILVIPKIYMFFAALITFTILTIYILKKNEFIEQKFLVLRTILFSFLGVFIITVIESSYMPILLFIIKTDINFVNNNILYNFLMSLPERLLEIIMIFAILINKNYSSSKIKLVYIFKQKTLLLATTIFTGIILFTLISVIRIIESYHVLNDFPVGMQIIIGVLLVVIPTLLVSIYFLPINLLIGKINKVQQSYDNAFDDQD